MTPQNDRENLFASLLRETPDLLSLIVKAHYSIDGLLDEVLKEALPNADAMEIERVSFLLKTDFLTGLGVLRSDLRPIFNLLNNIRNRFAHNPYAVFSDKDGRDARNILLSREQAVVPEKFRNEENPREILETLFYVGFINVVVAFERLCQYKAEMHVTNQLVDEYLSKVKTPEHDSLSVHERFEVRLRQYLDDRYPGMKRD